MAPGGRSGARAAFGVCDEAYALRRGGGGWLREVEVAYPYPVLSPPVFGLSQLWHRVSDRIPPVMPATRVLALEQGRVVSGAGWVTTDDRRAVVPLSWYENAPDPELPTGWSQERHLPGTVLNLASVGGWNNYAHRLLDGLGRAAVAEGAGVTVAGADWVLVSWFRSPTLRRLQRRLGLTPERTVRMSRELSITGDLVITPSMPGTTRVYRPVLPRFLRRLVQPPPAGRRVMIVRRGARRPMINLAELERRASRRGFEIIDPMQHFLPGILAQADVVIGEHGAALADLSFCRPGTQVVELLPSDHLYPYFYSLARAGGLSYRAVIGPSVHERDPGAFGPSPSAYRIAAEAFDAAVDAALAAAEVHAAPSVAGAPG